MDYHIHPKGEYLQIAFARGLERLYLKSEEARRQWGEAVARKYILRINTIKAARELQDLRMSRALQIHQLKGEREGQYAMSLHDRWRLIFAYNPDERSVTIIEVTNHYGD